jgi:hypothetical protein
MRILITCVNLVVLKTKWWKIIQLSKHEKKETRVKWQMILHIASFGIQCTLEMFMLNLWKIHYLCCTNGKSLQ